MKLTNTTVEGTFAGLTDAHIPNDLTASLYLPLTGGTLSAVLTGTSGTFDTLTVSSLTATSTDPSLFVQASTTLLSVFDTLYIGGTATSTIDSAGALTLSGLGTLTAGFISSASSTVSGTFHVSDVLTSSSSIAVDGNSLFALTSGSVGIASTSPSALLSVDGTGYISGTLFVGDALTATSTLAVGDPANPATGLASFYGGFISSASSTVSGPFHVSDNL